MSSRPPLHLFEGFGVELEYMIVDADSLSVRPITDRVMHAVAGEYVSEHELGEISWSNELALHVVELKTSGPAASLAPLPGAFQQHVARVNEILAPLGARLMPTAMHPWMHPDSEMRLWPHDYNAVYEQFNRIFDCRGHGWANLQSVHLNLPFADDEEFGRLHAAIRLILPILPALAASSPVMERRLTGLLDTRLETYRANARRIPSISGRVIPEAVYTRADYERLILQRIYRDIAPHDPEGILQHEWLNARGAIARFERNTIEIRVLDVQECPQSDLAICAAIEAVLRSLINERCTPLSEQQDFLIEPLEAVLLGAICEADEAVIEDAAYLRQFGWSGEGGCTTGELWQHLVERAISADPQFGERWGEPLRVITIQGPLARRIARALDGDTSDGRLRAVYGELCDCLAQGRMFTP